MNNKKIFVSVVVCTYNGEKRIGNCLKSLLSQDYPKENYEIIIVDDGSIDKTTEIVSRYPVKLIRHKKNLGIPSSRNTGLKCSKGKIIAYTDDDCICKKNWLSELIKSFRDESIIGVGGLTKSLISKTLTEKYMNETGYGNPSPIEFGRSKNPLYRFLIYLKNMLKPVSTRREGLIQVQDIYPSNASFNKKDLEYIGGFDEELKTSEDTDICTRLNKKFKNKKIVFNSKAIVLHKHQTFFIHFLKQIYFRAENTLKFYLKHKKFPPIFPFPILTIIISVLLSFFSTWLSLANLILLPQILYFWWPYNVLRKGRLYYLLFPYIQTLIELSTILGMLRGYIILKLKNHANNTKK